MNVTKLWSCGPAHDGGGDGGGEAQDVTYVEKANRVWEGRCIRIKTIEKMLILLLQISKFRLRRPRRGLPEAATRIAKILIVARPRTNHLRGSSGPLRM